MVKAPAQTEAISLSPALMGRDEMNLAEFPHAFLADRVPKGQKTLVFADPRGGLTVTASDAYGLPTATDADVLLALIYLTKIRNNFRDEKVNFSRYELIRLMNWADEGGSYKRLDESFNRWIGVSLIYDGCWWNNRLKAYTDAKMHIIETVEVLDNDARRRVRQGGQSGLPLSYFLWNRTFIESCQADNLRQLDLDTYFSLKSAVSKRLYRFLGKRFYLQPDCTFDLKEIAFDRVGLSRSYGGNAAKIKEKLQPSIDELEAKGFLKPMGKEDRYIRVDRGEWKIRLVRQASPALAPAPVPIEPPAPPPPPLVAVLISRGVGEKAATELVQQHPSETIAAKIEIFDWLDRTKDKRVAKNPAGYLVKSITDGYGVPKGFTSKADQEQAIENKRKADEADAKERRAKARERKISEDAAAYLKQLSPTQRAELEATVLAQASSESRANYESQSMARHRGTLLTVMVRDYVEQQFRSGALPLPSENAPPCPKEASQDDDSPFRLAN